jgi:hypothetical protein
MNNVRRAELTKARGLIEQAKEIIAQAASKERGYFDNMPANLQGGDTGQTADVVATRLEEADSSLDAVLITLDVIGVDPAGELERLARAGELADVPPEPAQTGEP